MQTVGKIDEHNNLSPEIILYLKNKFFDFLLDILSDLKLAREFLRENKTDLVDFELVKTVQKIWDFLSLF